MDFCYYIRKLFNRNKSINEDYNILLDEHKDVITIYCPNCGHKINSYK
jgi:hypothetical protein